MKKLIIVWIALLLAASLALIACGGDSGDDGNGPPKVYASGFSIDQYNVRIPGYWKDGTWVELDNLHFEWHSQANSIVVSGSSIYVGGFSRGSSRDSSGVLVANVTKPGYWKNGTWVQFPSFIEVKPSVVFSVAISGSDVYAGGYRANSLNTLMPGYWTKKGDDIHPILQWVELTPINGTYSSEVKSMVVSGSDIYAAGYSSNTSNIKIPGYWKNGTWIGLTTLDTIKNSDVASLVLSGSTIYAGGYSINSLDVRVAGYWEMTDGDVDHTLQWLELTPLDTTKSSEVKSVAVSGGNVYAAGYSTNSSNVLVPGYWKDGTWVELTPLDTTKSSAVNSLVVSGSDVYAGGYSTNSSDIQVPGYWKNGTWVGLTPILINKNSGVFSLTVVE